MKYIENKPNKVIMLGLDEQQYEIYWNVKERDQYNKDDNNNTIDTRYSCDKQVSNNQRLLSFYVNINQQIQESYQTRHTINCTLIQWKQK